MLRRALAQAFLETDSFKYDPQEGFTLASGVKSPYYVDCRRLLAHPHARDLVAQAAVDAIADLPVQCIGGLEIGAIPLATAISACGWASTPRREWRTFVVRKRAKDHGLGKLIEGAVRAGDRALVVDDVLTSGASVVTALRAAREAGLRVDHALVIVDRDEQGGRARVEADGVTLLRLVMVQELIALVTDGGASLPG